MQHSSSHLFPEVLTTSKGSTQVTLYSTALLAHEVLESFRSYLGPVEHTLQSNLLHLLCCRFLVSRLNTNKLPPLPSPLSFCFYFCKDKCCSSRSKICDFDAFAKQPCWVSQSLGHILGQMYDSVMSTHKF